MVHTLVLGAGGPVGGAWLGGLTARLVDAGTPLPDARQIVGTSAGSVLGAWLGQGADLHEFPELMADRAAWHRDRRTGPAPAVLESDEAAATWSRWLPGTAWPRSLRITSVAKDSGRLSVWSSDDGIGLGAAVGASTAAPGVVPPVRIGGRLHVDGAVRSPTNADAAASRVDTEDADVLVLAPVATPALDEEVELLRGLGCLVRVLRPDPADLGGVFVRGSATVLDPALIGPAARAGRDRAERALAEPAVERTVGGIA